MNKFMVLSFTKEGGRDQICENGRERERDHAGTKVEEIGIEKRENEEIHRGSSQSSF